MKPNSGVPEELRSSRAAAAPSSAPLPRHSIVTTPDSEGQLRVRAVLAGDNTKERLISPLRLQRIEAGSGATYPVVFDQPPSRRAHRRLKLPGINTLGELKHKLRRLLVGSYSGTWHRRIFSGNALPGEKPFQQAARFFR